ncbi:MAG TPA: AcvB/VirJ family lysyl-phosphatidylglycerol hydrolase, partial [Marinagarivorans sp.]|nr:AcvB/VirJ family lysyl-phosphatidylglycerol hydrolase [Marinagarivorans sp.]
PDKGHLIVFAASAEPVTERRALARRWADKGYLVSVIDPGFLKGQSACADLASPIAQLQHFIEQRYPQLAGLLPLVMGRGEAAALSFIALAQAPAKSFHSAIAVDFCPARALAQTFCPQRAWSGQPGVMAAPSQALGANAYVFQTPRLAASGTCDLVASEQYLQAVPSVKLSQAQGGADDWLEVDALLNWLDPRLTSQALSAQNDDDSPVVEVPAQSTQSADYFVLFLTGDGGWAQLDKELAQHFSAQGINVLGFDSLSYFWRKRSPEETAADISALISSYQNKWQKKQVVLLGYSFGADVLPYVAANLPKEQQAAVKHLVLLGLSQFAHFEFYLTNWLSSETKASPFATQDALKSIPAIAGLCVQGAEDDESICSQLQQPNIKSVTLPGDHHYDEDYDSLARIILTVLAGGEAQAVKPGATDSAAKQVN